MNTVLNPATVRVVGPVTPTAGVVRRAVDPTLLFQVGTSFDEELSGAENVRLDLLLRGATVYPGDGPPSASDVGVRDGVIVLVADRALEKAGLAVAEVVIPHADELLAVPLREYFRATRPEALAPVCERRRVVEPDVL